MAQRETAGKEEFKGIEDQWTTRDNQVIFVRKNIRAVKDKQGNILYYEGTVDADDRYLYWFLKTGMGPFPWLNIKDGQIIIGLSNAHKKRFRICFQFIDLLPSDLQVATAPRNGSLGLRPDTWVDTYQPDRISSRIAF